MEAVNIIGKFAENNIMGAMHFACGAHSFVCTVEGTPHPKSARVTVVVEEDRSIGIVMIPSVERHGVLMTPRIRREEKPFFDFVIYYKKRVEVANDSVDLSSTDEEGKTDLDKHFAPAPEPKTELVETSVQIRTSELCDKIYKLTVDQCEIDRIELVPAMHEPTPDQVTMNGRFGND